VQSAAPVKTPISLKNGSLRQKKNINRKLRVGFFSEWDANKSRGETLYRFNPFGHKKLVGAKFFISCLVDEEFEIKLS